MEAAFAGRQEADLVDQLRRDGDLILSLVAVANEVVGHVAVSRLTLERSDARASALAPIAVSPELQHRGIGTELIGEALRHLAECGEAVVLVLGPAAYYARFGFSSETARLFRTPYDGPHLMALALATLPLAAPVEVRYPRAFAALH